MKDNKDSIKIIFLAIAVFVFFILFALFIFYDFSKIASSTISKLTPGSATSQQVKEKLGEPDQIKESAGKTEYLYNTEKEEFKNTVVIEGEKVQSSREYIFDDSLGKLSDYEDKYGNPDFTMYDEEKDFLLWHIYLDEGLGVGGTDLNEVFELIYFEPQSESQFLQSTALQYGLVKERKSHANEVPVEDY